MTRVLGTLGIVLFTVALVIAGTSFADFVHYQNGGIGVEADGTNADVGLVAKGTGKVKSTTDIVLQTDLTGIRRPAAAVITPATSFPTPGGAELTKTTSIVAAAGPTAMYVNAPAATPYIGAEPIIVVNKAANPISIVPQGGTDTMNGKAAATPFACAANTRCTCAVDSANSWFCR